MSTTLLVESIQDLLETIESYQDWTRPESVAHSVPTMACINRDHCDTTIKKAKELVSIEQHIQNQAKPHVIEKRKIADIRRFNIRKMLRDWDFGYRDIANASTRTPGFYESIVKQGATKHLKDNCARELEIDLGLPEGIIDRVEFNPKNYPKPERS